MWYVFTEQFNKKWNRMERLVKCIGFFLVEKEASAEAKKHPSGFYCGKWSCSKTEQDAIKEKGWWNS